MLKEKKTYLEISEKDRSFYSYDQPGKPELKLRKRRLRHGLDRISKE